MRHRKRGRKLGRNASHRRALYRNLATSLVEYGRIETTVAKAKELRSVADKLIGLGKRGDLHARRQALGLVQKESAVAKLFGDISPRYASRNGGYTRIIATRNRLGDAAPMAVVEWVGVEPATPAVSTGGDEGAKGSGKKKDKDKD
jgi:large subunit ribosomal protein L17